MTIFIGHCQKEQNGPTIYVGRPTAMGNPFILGPHGTRAEVIDKYKGWFTEQLHADNSAFNTLLKKVFEDHEEHGDITLLCWCHPKACHADVIRQWIYFMERTVETYRD